MKDPEISRILLVRSVEEIEPDYFSPELKYRAAKESGDADHETAFIRDRAEYLFQTLPTTLMAVPQSLQVPNIWIVILAVLSFILGVVINYLGPGETIHVLYNPVIMLVLWNIFVFGLTLARYVYPGNKHGVNSARGKSIPVIAGHVTDPAKSPSLDLRGNFSFSSLTSAGSPLLRKMLMWRLKKQWTAVQHSIQKKKDRADSPPLKKIFSRYGEHWWALHKSAVIAKSSTVFHILAIALVIGALSGVYMRGLFSEYNVVWKSTFINEPSQITLLLNFVFGIPSLIVNGSMIQQPNVTPLLDSGGAPAAVWIHVFAVSVLLYVIVPRIIFMLIALRAAKRLSSGITIDHADPYYADSLSHGREIQTNHVREEIASRVQTGISELAESVGVYTLDRFYDKHVIPRLKDFRLNGGRITDLEKVIAEESISFEPELERFLRERQSEFVQSLASGISQTVGKELLPLQMPLDRDVQPLSSSAGQEYGAPVTRDMTSAISITVTTAIAASLGTISGGFGKALGVAVISTLLHTTGPVGFLIGALAGLLLGGSAALLAKEKITGMVQDQHFPGFVTQLVLSKSKLAKSIAEGRSQVYQSTKKEIEEKLSPYIDEITNRIASEIQPVMREQRR